jgi:hypothetical protein
MEKQQRAKTRNMVKKNVRKGGKRTKLVKVGKYCIMAGFYGKDK